MADDDHDEKGGSTATGIPEGGLANLTGLTSGTTRKLQGPLSAQNFNMTVTLGNIMGLFFY